MAEYQSSEELQRASRGAFVDEKEAKEEEEKQSEHDKLKKTLDKYIKKHETTKGVREERKKHEGRSLELQFGISDGIVEILEKIKNELRS